MINKVFDKKKVNFWRLAVIFGCLTIAVLFLLWSQPQPRMPMGQMMKVNMGSMMIQMHGSNPPVIDLLKSSGTQDPIQSSMREMASHHQNQTSVIFKLNFLTTAVIFLLLPLLTGGAVILTIIWIK